MQWNWIGQENDMRFSHIFVGWPGRSHDARVFKNNPLYRTLPSRLRAIPLPRLAEMYHNLADSAFPLSPQVMTSIRKPINRDSNYVERNNMSTLLQENLH